MDSHKTEEFQIKFQLWPNTNYQILKVHEVIAFYLAYKIKWQLKELLYCFLWIETQTILILYSVLFH